MDIHAPDKPVHSLKEFAIHIAIVTIGILIALGLEGIREAVHDHHLVRETRENFSTELRADQEHAHEELKAVTLAETQLEQLLNEYPQLAHQPANGISARLHDVHNPGYFFLVNGWQTALSTGAFAHMKTEEVGRYADVYEIIRIYIRFQGEGQAARERATAFFIARPQLTPADYAHGAELLAGYQRAEDSMQNIALQMSRRIDEVLKLSE